MWSDLAGDVAAEFGALDEEYAARIEVDFERGMLRLRAKKRAADAVYEAKRALQRKAQRREAAVERARPAVARFQAAKTHCPSGHPLSGDNLVVFKDGKRRCRACRVGRVGRAAKVHT